MDLIIPGFTEMSFVEQTVIALLGVLYVAVGWRLLAKAGEHGWKALIPVYNIYEMFRITTGRGLLCLFLLIPFRLPRTIGLIILAVCTGMSFRKGFMFKLGLMFFPVIFYPMLAFSDDRYYGPNGFGSNRGEAGGRGFVYSDVFTTSGDEGPGNVRAVEFETIKEEGGSVTPESEIEDFEPIEEPSEVMDVIDVEVTREEGNEYR